MNQMAALNNRTGLRFSASKWAGSMHNSNTHSAKLQSYIMARTDFLQTRPERRWHTHTHTHHTHITHITHTSHTSHTHTHTHHTRTHAPHTYRERGTHTHTHTHTQPCKSNQNRRTTHTLTLAHSHNHYQQPTQVTNARTRIKARRLLFFFFHRGVVTRYSAFPLHT